MEDADEQIAVAEAKKAYWAPLLQTVLWAYRITPHTVTGASPAMLTLGVEPRLPIDMRSAMGTAEAEARPPGEEGHRELVADRLPRMCDMIPGLREIKEPKGVDKSPPQFEMGQKVWKRESKYDSKGFTPVFAPRWIGPFIIHAVWDKNVYKLRTDPLVTGRKVGYLKNPVNGFRLKAYVEGELLS